MGKFLLALIAIPLLETWLLIRMGGVIGALPTIALVIATAVIGGALVRRQGLQTVARMQQNAAQGVLPSREIAEGVLILIAATLLITPGFFTDTIGFLCLWPQFRRKLIDAALQRGLVQVVGGAGAGAGFAGARSRHGPGGGGRTFEGEFEVQDEPSPRSTDLNPPR